MQGENVHMGERGRTWGMYLYEGPWVEHCRVPRQGSDWRVQTKRAGCSKLLGALSKGRIRHRGSGRQEDC